MDSLAHNRENSLFSEIFAYNIWLQAAIFKALRVFGQALSNMGKRSREELLLKIIEDFEKKSGFSEQVSLAKCKTSKDEIDVSKYGEVKGTGILTEQQFMGLLKCKHPINDFGAGFQHGAFTHRLQWYLFGQELNDHPKKYQKILGMNYSLNADNLGEFYAKLGDPEFQKMFDFSQLRKHRSDNKIPPHLNGANLWVQVFDRYGYDGYWSVPSTFGFMKDLGFFEGLPVRSTPNNANVCVILEKVKEHLSGERQLPDDMHEHIKVHR